MRLGRAISRAGAGEAPPVRYDYRVAFRVLRFVGPDTPLVVASILVMFVYSATIVAAPWIIQRAINSVITGQSSSDLRNAAILLVVNAVVGYVTNYVHLTTLSRVGQNLLFRLRRATFDHIQRLSLSYFDRREVGSIMSRVQNDVQQLQEFLSIFVLALSDLVVLGGIVVAMLLMKWQLALIIFAVVPVLVIMMIFWQRYALRVFMRVRREIAEVTAELQENISGVRVIQSLNRQEENLQHFDATSRRYLNTSLGATRLTAALNPSVEMLSAVSTGLVIVFGGVPVLRGDLAMVGVLVAFALYIQRFFDPIRSLTMQYGQLQRAMASGQHIFEILDTQPQIVDPPGAPHLPRLRGEVTFEKVSFSYTPEIPVLKEVALRILPGEKVALVGPTGAGKTTLVSLLSRLYDVTGGSIKVDGYDLREIDRVSLNRQVSVVPQEPFLFSGTVKNNIRFSRPETTEQEVVDAAGVVGAHDFIAALEEGYDTQVQERGLNFSPGQRQLIALARALVADPRIVILDEATATVDSRTELLVQEALKVVLEGRTALIIAHRLSTVRGADRILVMDRGRIVEQGTHAELLAAGNLYARLYSLNTRA